MVLVVERTITNDALHNVVAGRLAPLWEGATDATADGSAMDVATSSNAVAATAAAVEEDPEAASTMEMDEAPQRRHPFKISVDRKYNPKSNLLPDDDSQGLVILDSNGWGEEVVGLEVELQCEVDFTQQWPRPDHESVTNVVSTSPSSASNSNMTLNKAMDLFTKREQLSEQDTVYCSNCKVLVPAHLHSTPSATPRDHVLCLPSAHTRTFLALYQPHHQWSNTCWPCVQPAGRGVDATGHWQKDFTLTSTNSMHRTPVVLHGKPPPQSDI